MEDFVTTIDYLFVADHVEVVNGKLYVNGGGWSDITRLPNQLSHFGIGLSLCIPWNETNQPHDLLVRLENEDSNQELAKAEMQINVGRPPTLPKGSDQHLAIGMMLSTVFPSAGGYRVTAEVDQNQQMKHWAFRVHDGKQ
jgi:hypothetical protein